MKMLMRAWMLSILFFVGSAVAAPPLIGTWSGTADGEPLTVTFAAGGQGTVNGEAMSWQVLGNMLFVEQGGEVQSYQVQQQGDTLQVAGGAFASVVELKRGAAAKAPAKEKPGKPAAAGAGATAPELVGRWCKGGSFSANASGGSSSQTCFELKADGSFTYEHEGSMSAYAPGAWGGSTSQGSDSGQWSVSGNRLTARSVSGQASTYVLEKRNHPKNRDPMICLDGDCYTTWWQKAPW